MFYYFKDKNCLKAFKNRKEQIGIIKRKVHADSDNFFRMFKKFPFSIAGKVYKDNTKQNIEFLLKNIIPGNIKNIPFYQKWIEDMSSICKTFISFEGNESLSFWLGSDRGCKRFHIDMVSFRLLVTYAGQGTELLPNEAANREAFVKGKSNQDIIKDKSAIKYLNKWDIALFRGGDDGILHRTPDSALNGDSSILMRLDSSSFLDEIIKINEVA